MIKRALISVFDKTNVLELAKFLMERGVEIISTGGTYKHLETNGIPVIDITELTGFDEILDGRVKTLHPKVHGGLLAIRENEAHMATVAEKEIKLIDMVVVNLYPFFDKLKENLAFDEQVEFIDIGGPTMLRSAAKNFRDVLVLSDIKDYEKIISEINETNMVSFDTRKRLAGKVFNLTSAYDASISQFMLDEEYPEYLALSYKKLEDLRYGENPHQTSACYVNTDGKGMMNQIKQLNGKALSYNNIKDMDIAWKTVWEFEEIACCGLKHNTPCGVAIASSVSDAYKKAHACDPVSIFGGIVALNREVDDLTAKEIVKTFIEVVIAPSFSEASLEILRTKKNLRVIECKEIPKDAIELAKVDGGILVQSADQRLLERCEVVTEVAPNEESMKDMIFGMKVVKYVKSNAIVVVKDGQAIGVGAGQVNRIWAAKQALERAGKDAILASDAFFPFRDVVDEAAKYNVKGIIQPGGSIRDQESIDACNEHKIPMVFTGIRHFKH